MSRTSFRSWTVLIILAFTGSAFAERRPEVQRAVMIHLDQVKACYRNALKAMPKPKTGKITLEWAVDDKGKSSHVVVVPKKSTLRDAQLEKCLIQKAQTWKLPPSAKGKTTFVSFPFYFNKTKPLKPKKKKI